jgi:hypothetical protein
MSAGDSGKLPELSGFNENGFENINSGEGMSSTLEQPPMEVGTGETVATGDTTTLEVATGEPVAAAPNTTRKKGRDYSMQAQVLADINEAIKRMYPEDKKKAHIAVVGPALKAKKEGSNTEYREAVDLAAERVHQGLSFPKKGAVAEPTMSKKRSRLTNALNAARALGNSGTVAASVNSATAVPTVPPPRPRRSRPTAAAALANAFPRNSNSVAPISASATTNEKERLLSSLTSMRDSAKEMIDTMYMTANKLVRGAAATNNGGLIRTINSGVPATVTRKVRKNKGVARGARTTAKVSSLPTIPEETNSALRSNSGMAHVNNLSALEPSPIEAGQQQDEGSALATAEN